VFTIVASIKPLWLSTFTESLLIEYGVLGFLPYPRCRLQKEDWSHFLKFDLSTASELLNSVKTIDRTVSVFIWKVLDELEEEDDDIFCLVELFSEIIEDLQVVGCILDFWFR
jgi:hypothetical protein